jgi:hypothetical protein
VPFIPDSSLSRSISARLHQGRARPSSGTCQTKHLSPILPREALFGEEAHRLEDELGLYAVVRREEGIELEEHGDFGAWDEVIHRGLGAGRQAKAPQKMEERSTGELQRFPQAMLSTMENWGTS